MEIDKSDVTRIYAWGRKINILWTGIWEVK